MTGVDLVADVGLAVWTAWCLGGATYELRRRGRVRDVWSTRAWVAVYHELRPAAPVAMLLANHATDVVTGRSPTVAQLLVDVLCLWWWWRRRRDDDDRWDRRARRLAGRVRELASGRLAVAPEPT